ncbi:MAG: hypothetical protein JO128_07900 [Alphaproteobacteria bacterium]|nr:hypothetical protein [Alphaproteobacteria bacterium]
MKTPLLDLIPGLAVAAAIVHCPAPLHDADEPDDHRAADSAREPPGKSKARQDCKPP